MRFVLAILVMLAMFPLMALANNKIHRFPSPNGKEMLNVPVPSHWKLDYHANAQGQMIAEFVPHDQSVDNWRQLITVQIFDGYLPLSGKEILDNITATSKQVCQNYSSKLLDDRPTDNKNYAVVELVQYCGKYAQTGLGEVTFFKIIKGKDAMYVVQRAWRGQPFEQNKLPVSNQTITAWQNDFHQAVLSSK